MHLYIYISFYMGKENELRLPYRPYPGAWLVVIYRISQLSPLGLAEKEKVGVLISGRRSRARGT